MTDTKNLLPCPMCGCSSINVKNEQPTDNSGGYFIECPDCGISTSLRYACGDDPIPLLAEQWNRRATAQCLHQIAEPAPTESVLIDGTDYVVHAEVAAELLRLHIELKTAPQAVQPAVPEGWVPCVITYEGQQPEEIAYGPQIMMDRLKKWLDRYFEMRTAPAHPAEGVPAPMPVAHPHHCTARTADGSCEECEGHAQAMAEWNTERAALAATHPAAAHGVDAEQDIGDAEADRLIGRLLSADPDFEDCAAAANFIQSLTQNGPDGFATWKDAAVAERVLRAGMQRAISALPRVTYGYKSDGDGYRYLTTYEVPDGKFLRHADVVAAIAAQAKQAEAMEMARKGGCGCCASACADRADGCKFVHESPSEADMREKVNRYCGCRMCLETDVEHEPTCHRHAAQAKQGGAA